MADSLMKPRYRQASLSPGFPARADSQLGVLALRRQA